ncbi:MAG: DUF4838 domain-containing protein [Clostridia bacterium]|nr:DUF4838 domain-containing protein [Clostridia bacterium]
MKKLLSLLLAVCLTAALCIPASAQADKVLFSADVSCRIVLPRDAAPQEEYAARTLRDYLERITGKAFAVTTDDTRPDGAEIAVGNTNRSADEALADGAYHIFFAGETLCIRGGGNKGAIGGVYAFLRTFCGCRWYARDTVTIPQTDALSLPASVDVTYTPFFEYAETDWLTSAFDPEFSLANGLNGGNCRTLSDAQGGVVRYYPFCHSLSTVFCARDKYFDAHPEYFALHDGKRSPNQLCLTNPDTQRIVQEEVLAYLCDHHDPDADLQIVSITQDDNGDYCECPSCKALDDLNGSHAGTNVTFANAVADKVKEAGYDNVAIDTFAYQYTRKTPTHVVPRDNVIIRLCSIECCFCHTLDDPHCKENRSFMQDLRDWNEICRRIYVWDYTCNYWETVCLYPDFGVLQRNMQIFYENNVKGVFEEGNSCEDCDAEFSELRAYLLARLMQDPYLDFDAEMRGFLDAYYGPGGEAICRFLVRTTEKAGASRTAHLGTFPDSTDTLTRFTASDVAYCDAQWETAKALTEGTEYFARVERSELCWRWWKCNNRRGEYAFLRSTLYSRMASREALYNDLKRFGVARTSVARPNRGLTECMSLVLLRRGEKWAKLYDEKYWDFLEPFVLRLYGFLDSLHK